MLPDIGSLVDLPPRIEREHPFPSPDPGTCRPFSLSYGQRLVAGGGFEPSTAWLMRPTDHQGSPQCSPIVPGETVQPGYRTPETISPNNSGGASGTSGRNRTRSWQFWRLLCVRSIRWYGWGRMTGPWIVNVSRPYLVEDSSLRRASDSVNLSLYCR